MEWINKRRFLCYYLLVLCGSSLLHLSFAQGILRFREGEKVVLDCRTVESVNTKIIYRWTKNNTDIIAGGRISIDANGRLVITNSSVIDRGKYTCYANSVQKISLSLEIVKMPLVKADLKTYFIKIRLANNDKHTAIIRYMVKGEAKEFVVPSNNHKTEIISIQSTTQPQKVVFRAFDSVDNAPLQMNDQDTFSILPSLSGQEVTIHIPNAYLWFVNQIPGNVQHIKKKVGQSVVLDCFARGFPPPEVYWFKWNKSMSEVSYRLLDLNSIRSLWTLKMKDLVIADSGDYHCTVKNRLATTRRNFHLVVEELEAGTKPEITIFSPRNKTIQVGAEIVFHCESSFSKVMPFIRWERRLEFNFMNNQSLVNSTNKLGPAERSRIKYMEKMITIGNVTVRNRPNGRELIEFIKTERTFSSNLKIPQADYTDEAEYKCIIFNAVGYSAALTKLYVRPAPEPSLQDLANHYAEKYGTSAPYTDLPLSVIIALPVGLVILLVIGFIWWNEQHHKRNDADRISLIPVSTLRNDDMFDSEEHLPSHYPKNHQKRLSQGRTNTSEEDNRLSLLQDGDVDETSLENVLTNPLIDNTNHVGKGKKPIKDEEMPECDRRTAVLALSELGVYSPAHSSINCSEVELEWEPQDLDLNIGLVH